MSIIKIIQAQFFQKGIARALKHRNFRIFVLTNWFNTFGNWFQRVGIGWLAWQLTHSEFWLGAVAFAEAVPLLVFIIFAGAIIDRVNSIFLLRSLQILVIIQGILIATLTTFDLINIISLTILAMCNGMIQTFHLPIRLTIVPRLVPLNDLTPSVGLNSALFNIARFVSPAIAGFIIAKYSVEVIFWLSIIGFVIFAIGLAIINPINDARHQTRTTGLYSDVINGLSYLTKHASIGPLLLYVFIGASFSRSFMDLAPSFADVVFKQGVEGLGLILSAIGIGGVAGATGLANYGRTKGLVKVCLSSLAITAVLLIVFTSSQNFVLALICCLGLGITLAISTNAPQILIQNTVDEDMRGRVMSIYSLTYRAGPAIGALIIGAISSYVNLQLAVASGAIICLICVLIMFPKRTKLAAEMESTRTTPMQPTTNNKVM